MKRSTFRQYLWLAFFVLTVQVTFGSTNATEVVASMRKLVAADWIERDGQLNGQSRQDKSNDFSSERTRQIIARACKLAGRLQQLTGYISRLEPLGKELKQIEVQTASLESVDDADADVRRRIYLDARWTVRRTAFCNPLLDFDKMLFIKRHHPGGVFHMYDRYYGFNAIAGGGLSCFLSKDSFTNKGFQHLASNEIITYHEI